MHVFTQGKIANVVPMGLRADAGRSLIDFMDDVGVPETLVTDGVSEFTGDSTEFVEHAWHVHVLLHATEAGHKNQNHLAECEIGILS